LGSKRERKDLSTGLCLHAQKKSRDGEGQGVDSPLLGAILKEPLREERTDVSRKGGSRYLGEKLHNWSRKRNC